MVARTTSNHIQESWKRYRIRLDSVLDHQKTETEQGWKSQRKDSTTAKVEEEFWSTLEKDRILQASYWRIYLSGGRGD